MRRLSVVLQSLTKKGNIEMEAIFGLVLTALSY